MKDEDKFKSAFELIHGEDEDMFYDFEDFGIKEITPYMTVDPILPDNKKDRLLEYDMVNKTWTKEI